MSRAGKTGFPPRLEVDLALAVPGFTLDVAFATDSGAVGLFGPSGAGKTTVLEAIAGIGSRGTGRIVLGGETWLDSERRIRRPPDRRDVGYVPQEGLLFPHLDARQNLLAGSARARRRGIDPRTLLATVSELLELDRLLDRPVARLSGGERQRVALGRALVSGPRLLLLDEPLASLDLPLRRRILPLLVRVRETLGVPMLFVSHQPTEVQALCDEVVVIDRGRVVAQGPTHDALTDPAVFPLAASDGYQTVIDATVAEHTATETGGGTVIVAGSTLRIATPRPASPAGTRIGLGIPAEDVMLARELSGKLSARNRLPAEVVSVERVGDVVVVRSSIAADVPPIAALLTPAAQHELRVAAGERVVLIFKANACKLLERTNEKGPRLH